MFNQVYELYGRHMNLIAFTAPGPTPIRWRPMPTPSPWRSRSTPSPPSAGRRRRPPTRTSWPGSTCSAWRAATPATYGQIQRTTPTSGQPPDGRHVALRDRRLRRRKLKSKEPSGPRSLLHARRARHRRQRHLGTARRRVGRAHHGADPEADAGPVGMASTRSCGTRSTSRTCRPGRHDRRETQTSARRASSSPATLMPIYLTEGLRQSGFPEWIITGIVLTDVDLRALLDQQESAHASAYQPGRAGTRRHGDADQLYRWWYGATRLTGLPAAPAPHPAHSAVLRRRATRRSRPHTHHLRHGPPPGPGCRGGPDVAAPVSATRAPRRGRVLIARCDTFSGTTARRRGRTRRARRAAA